MQVSKILIVESPIHLWELMKNKEEIYENNKQLLLFFDFVQLLLSDCRCNHDENYKLVEMRGLKKIGKKFALDHSVNLISKCTSVFQLINLTIHISIDIKITG